MKRLIAVVFSLVFLLCCLPFSVYAVETDTTDGDNNADETDILGTADTMFVTQSSSLFRLTLDTLNIQRATSGAGATSNDVIMNWVECDIVKVSKDNDTFALTIKDNKSVTLYSELSVIKGNAQVGASNASYFAFKGADKQLNFGVIANNNIKSISVYSNTLNNMELLDDFKDKVSGESTFTEGFTSTFDLKGYAKPISKDIFENIIAGNAKYDSSEMKEVSYKIYKYDTNNVTKFMTDAKGGTVSSTDELTYNSATGAIDGWKALDTDYTIFNGWMSADTSSITGKATSQCYVIVEVKFKLGSEDVEAGKQDESGFYTYPLYGTMWIAPAASGDDNCLLLYMSPDLSSIGSAVEKSGGNANTMDNLSNSANMINWDTYDVKNDVDIGDNLGTITFDERDLDDKTISRLAEIRREMQLRKAQSTKDWFDIVMKIGGIVVLVYTIVLAVAYVFDTSNTVLDIELMRIVTFNRVVCVRDNEDLKYMQEKGSSQFLLTKKYFIIYMIVGVLLSVFMLNTDIIRIVAEAVYSVFTK